MPTFIATDRRLIMRYASGRAFSFTTIRANASDQGVFDVANAFASIQDDSPSKITTVVTRQLV